MFPPRSKYKFRRAHQSFAVAFSVWRANRAVADAFYNPISDGFRLDQLFPLSRKVIQRTKATFIVAIGIIAVVIVTTQWKSAARIPVPTAPLGTPSENDFKRPEIIPPSPPVAASAFTVSLSNAPSQPYRFTDVNKVLMVCKRDRTLYVYIRADGKKWQKTAAFPMAFGRKPGNKADSGDLRTPEGNYWIIGMASGTSKGPMYGALVFSLNYPDPTDKAEGKTGQGIWIHGVEAGRLPNFTHGCLSLSNKDMLALSAYADIGTPVIILPDSSFPEPKRQLDGLGMEREYPAIMQAYGRKTHQDTLEKQQVLASAQDFVSKESKDFPELDMQPISEQDRKAILARIQKWRDDWSSRNLDAYATNYALDFRDGEGRNWSAFLERKRKIFASKSKISMEIGETQLESEGYARVKVSFRQDYVAEDVKGLQRSSGTKTVRLEDSPAGWLIISE